MEEGRIISAVAHDDMMGYITTGLANSHQYLEKEVRDTGFPIPHLRNNSGDYYCVYAQSFHRRKHNVNLDSIHMHIHLDQPYTAGQTIVWELYYNWVVPNTIHKPFAEWTQLPNIVQTYTTNLPQFWDTNYSLVVDVPFPNPEGYGATLLWRIVRGNGTYTGNVGIYASDAHVPVNKDGSKYEFSDTL